MMWNRFFIGSLVKFIWILGIVMLVGTWALTIHFFISERHARINHSIQDTSNLANVLEKHITGTFSEIENSLFSLRKIKESGVSDNEMLNLLKQFVNSKPELYNLISIIGTDGLVQMTNLEEFNVTYSGDRDFFLFHKDNVSMQLLIEEPLLGRVTGKWYIPVSMRLEDSTGNFIGVLLASINPYYFSSIFSEVNLGTNSLIYLASNDGTIYSGFSSEILLLDKKLAPLLKDEKRHLSSIAKSSFDNVKRIKVVYFLDKQPMYIYIGIDYYNYLKEFHLKILYLLIIYVLFTALILFYIKKIIHSLKQNELLNKEINAFFNASLDMLAICDTKGNLLRVNNSWQKLLDYTESNLLNSSIFKIVYPDDLESSKSAFNEVVRSGKVIDYNSRIVSKNGTLHYIEWRGVKEGNAIHLAARDICQRKKNEQRMLTLSQALEQSQSLVLMTDLAGKINYVNPKFTQVSGYTPEEVLYKDMEFFNDSDFSTPLHSELWSTIESGRIWKGIFKNKKKNGVVFWESATISPIINEKNEIISYMKVAEDITNKQISEEKLKYAYEQIKAILSAIPDLMFIFDKNGRITDYHPKDTYSNPKFYVPPSNFLNKKIDEIFSKDISDLTYKKIREVLSTQDNAYSTYSIDINNEKHYFEARYVPCNKDEVLSIVRDITERHKAEEQHEKMQKQLIQAQKMESIGRLAGGVAHDFNNMLGVIISNIEIELYCISPNSSTYNRLLEIKKAALRSADLTRQLLSFARKQEIIPKVININTVIKSMYKILKRLINESISLEFQEGQNLSSVKMDTTQVDQLLANLCVNARDAIKDSGKIIIRTENIYCDESFCEKYTYLKPGEYVLLEISDDGCGMDSQTINQIFEPFFTTKKDGEGTGLGLATVYGIVKQNKGFVNVYSEIGKGTSFKIYLPVFKGQESSQTNHDVKNQIQTGTETILIVEDEVMILNVTSGILTRAGYNVLVADNPEIAISECKRHQQKIDLLLTDVVMPKMNGNELAKQLKELYPNLKVLFMSGYTSNMISQHGVFENRTNFLQKPFSVNDLTNKVRDCLK